MTFPDHEGSGTPPDDPLFDDQSSDEKGSRAGFVPELVRKAAVAGLGALFMTEEGIRNLAGQLKLPKEVLSFVLSQAEKTKDDISRVASEELRRFFQSEILRNEFLKLLAGMTVEIKAEVRLVPNKSEGPAQTESAVPKVAVTEIKAHRAKTKKEH